MRTFLLTILTLIVFGISPLLAQDIKYSYDSKKHSHHVGDDTYDITYDNNSMSFTCAHICPEDVRSMAKILGSISKYKNGNVYINVPLKLSFADGTNLSFSTNGVLLVEAYGYYDLSIVLYNISSNGISQLCSSNTISIIINGTSIKHTINKATIKRMVNLLESKTGKKFLSTTSSNSSSNSASSSSSNSGANRSSNTTTAANDKHNGHQYVDLGLSVKWATCNVGANAPEQNGNYYAWGETTPKTTFAWYNYKWCRGTWDTMTKYCTESKWGTVDNKTTLDPQDDVAHVNWGGNWRLPNTAEYDELRTKCTWTWTTRNGMKGYVVKGPNGNSIFLPAAGYGYASGLGYAGTEGRYWTNSLLTSSSNSAYALSFKSDNVDWIGNFHCFGGSVRPVYGNYTPSYSSSSSSSSYTPSTSSSSSTSSYTPSYSSSSSSSSYTPSTSYSSSSSYPSSSYGYSNSSNRYNYSYSTEWNSAKNYSPVGMSFGYVQKQWVYKGTKGSEYEGISEKHGVFADDGEEEYVNGIQIGLRYEPQWKYGFGMNTGLYYEYYWYTSGSYYDDYGAYYSDWQEHSLYVPLHLEFRANISEKFQFFAYGGVGFDLGLYSAIDYIDDEYGDLIDTYDEIYDDPENEMGRFNASLEFGGGVRIGSLQLQFQASNGLVNMAERGNKDYTVYQNKPLTLSATWVF